MIHVEFVPLTNTVLLFRSDHSLITPDILLAQQPSLAARYLEKKTRRLFFFFVAAPQFMFPWVNPTLTR